MDFKDGMCWIENGDKMIGKGYKVRVYIHCMQGQYLLRGTGQTTHLQKSYHGTSGTNVTHFNISTPNAQKGKISQWTKYRSIVNPIKKL